MDRYAPRPTSSICEFGGANSCFYDDIRCAYPDALYTAVDSNELGLRLLEKRASGQRTRALRYDLTSMPGGLIEADVVFSVGLIEHFDREQTAHVIDHHFRCATPGGLVIVTFPTPTWLYRATRNLAEAAGMWRFPDERPLLAGEVLASVNRNGRVLTQFTNWPVILTQGVVAASAR
jgi:cyclopropane fatty-acyl-phospholipid synthase-like methyltransferase